MAYNIELSDSPYICVHCGHAIDSLTFTKNNALYQKPCDICHNIDDYGIYQNALLFLFIITLNIKAIIHTAVNRLYKHINIYHLGTLFVIIFLGGLGQILNYHKTILIDAPLFSPCTGGVESQSVYYDHMGIFDIAFRTTPAFEWIIQYPFYHIILNILSLLTTYPHIWYHNLTACTIIPSISSFSIIIIITTIARILFLLCIIPYITTYIEQYIISSIKPIDDTRLSLQTHILNALQRDTPSILSSFHVLSSASSSPVSSLHNININDNNNHNNNNNTSSQSSLQQQNITTTTLSTATTTISSLSQSQLYNIPEQIPLTHILIQRTSRYHYYRLMASLLCTVWVLFMVPLTFPLMWRFSPHHIFYMRILSHSGLICALSVYVHLVFLRIKTIKTALLTPSSSVVSSSQPSSSSSSSPSSYGIFTSPFLPSLLHREYLTIWSIENIIALCILVLPLLFRAIISILFNVSPQSTFLPALHPILKAVIQYI